MGVRRPGRARPGDLHVGRQVRAGGPDDGEHLARHFPWQNLLLDRYEGTSPIESYPPNGYGLYDMAGNVWEWTDGWFGPEPQSARQPCCAPQTPHASGAEPFPRKVIKGGSHLCAPNYCLRYRPAARQGEALDTSTGHIGFRCVIRQGA